ncbi:MAG: DUF302 domain-containing protein [Armatimonadetes bacterium]|nr:DUF302 domain-containing protein [Armatimonadota bacterium]
MFHYTLESDAPFEKVVEALEAEAPRRQFRVLHVHDVTKTLAEKGFEMVPLKIIEVCSAKYAKQALDADRMVSLMMPCRISVWSEGGKTHISTIRPDVIREFYPGKGLESFAREVEAALKLMMDAAASLKG